MYVYYLFYHKKILSAEDVQCTSCKLPRDEFCALAKKWARSIEREKKIPKKNRILPLEKCPSRFFHKRARQNHSVFWTKNYSIFQKKYLHFRVKNQTGDFLANIWIFTPNIIIQVETNLVRKFELWRIFWVDNAVFKSKESGAALQLSTHLLLQKRIFVLK